MKALIGWSTPRDITTFRAVIILIILATVIRIIIAIIITTVITLIILIIVIMPITGIVLIIPTIVIIVNSNDSGKNCNSYNRSCDRGRCSSYNTPQ